MRTKKEIEDRIGFAKIALTCDFNALEKMKAEFMIKELEWVLGND